MSRYTAIIMVSPEQSPQLSGSEALNFISSRIASRNFGDFTDAENIIFAYETLRWLYQAFYVPGYGKEIYSSFDGFNGEEVPDSIKPLITYEWQDKSFLGNENQAGLLTAEETVTVPAVIPQYQELRDKGMNYPDLIDYISVHPEIYENIEFARTYIFDQLEVFFAPSWVADWGLDFLVRRDAISVMPYGKRGKNRAAVEYANSHRERVRLLTRTVVDLGILAVRHSDKVKYASVPIDLCDSFDRRLSGDDQILESVLMVNQGGGIEGEIIRILLKKGIIEPPDEPHG